MRKTDDVTAEISTVVSGIALMVFWKPVVIAAAVYAGYKIYTKLNHNNRRR